MFRQSVYIVSCSQFYCPAPFGWLLFHLLFVNTRTATANANTVFSSEDERERVRKIVAEKYESSGYRVLWPRFKCGACSMHRMGRLSVWQVASCLESTGFESQPADCLYWHVFLCFLVFFQTNTVTVGLLWDKRSLLSFTIFQFNYLYQFNVI
jgi:hypothetical protein